MSVLGREQREGRAGAAEGLPCTIGMEHNPFPDHALSRDAGIAPGFSKMTWEMQPNAFIQSTQHKACPGWNRVACFQNSSKGLWNLTGMY